MLTANGTSKMKVTDSAKKTEFFFGGSRVKTILILIVVQIAFILSVGVLCVVGLLQYHVSIVLIMLCPSFYTLWYIWTIWRGRHYPVVSLSNDQIEWGSPFSRKRDTIPTAEIVGIESIDRDVVVVVTRSGKNVRICLHGLSKENYQVFRDLMEDQFSAVS